MKLNDWKADAMQYADIDKVAAKEIKDMTPAEFARDLQKTAERETAGFPGFPE